MKLSDYKIFLSALEVLHFPVQTMTFKDLEVELPKLKKYFFPESEGIVVEIGSVSVISWNVEKLNTKQLKTIVSILNLLITSNHKLILECE